MPVSPPRRGQNITAQGNALGGGNRGIPRPERARQRSDCIDGFYKVFRPFRATNAFLDSIPRALPWADIWLPLRGVGESATSKNVRCKRGDGCVPRSRFGLLLVSVLPAIGISLTRHTLPGLRRSLAQADRVNSYVSNACASCSFSTIASRLGHVCWQRPQFVQALNRFASGKLAYNSRASSRWP